MAERKSKPRKKKEDEDEPTGVRRLTQNPWFLIVMYVLIIAVVIGALFGLASWLSGGV